MDGTDYLHMREDDIIGIVARPPASPSSVFRIEENRTMAAKDVRFGESVRNRMVSGVNVLANAVKVTLGPGPQCRARAQLRRADDHQGRCVGREGNRAQGQVREHGRADGEGSRVEDVDVAGDGTTTATGARAVDHRRRHEVSPPA